MNKHWLFPAIGLGLYLSSCPGQAQMPFLQGDHLFGLTHDGAHWVAAGFNSSNEMYGVVFQSPDGRNWTRQAYEGIYGFGSVAWGNGQFVALEYNRSSFLTSMDGWNWSQHQSGLPWPLRQILFAAGRFVAVGDGGTILTSTDGQEWSYPSSQTEYDLLDVAYGNGHFVAVGRSGAVVTSTNGLAWANQYGGTIYDLAGVAYGNDRFVSLSTSWLQTQILISPNGMDWTPALPNAHFMANRIYFGNGLFLLPREDQVLQVSTDGLTWKAANSGLDPITALACHQDQFIALRLRDGPLTSTDGITWTILGVPNSEPTIINSNGATTNEVLAGTDFVCPLSVEGNPLPACQWQYNGLDLPGANSMQLQLWGVTTNQAGIYWLIASNSLGAVTSRVYTLEVKYQAPQFLVSPSNQVRHADNWVNFSARVTAGPPASYQWLFNQVPIAGATNSNLSLVNIATNQAGLYSLVASNFLGAITSQVATLTVKTSPPHFYSWPADITVTEGAKVFFQGYADGNPYPTYHLLFNGTNLDLPWRYGHTFTLLEATTHDAGNYALVASNYLGAVTSQVATLTVTPGGPLDRWTRRNPLPQGHNLLSVTQGRDTYVAVGEFGSIVSSTNGTNWTVQSLRTDVDLTKVAYGDGQFIAVGGSGNLLRSITGTTWTLQRQEESGLWLNSVAYGDGMFVAVSGYGGNPFLTSPDGLNWTPVEFPGLNLGFMDIAFGNHVFVAVSGADFLYTSTNGTHWEPQTGVDYGRISRITYGNGRFVGVGNNGFSAVSFDGFGWTSRYFGSQRRFLGVAFGNGLFVTVGTRGSLYTSPDGFKWTPRNSTTPDRLESVTFAQNQFVALGENGTTLTSPDGIFWTRQNLGTTRDLDGMTLGDGLVVMAGKYGTILTSTNGIAYEAQTTGTTNNLHAVAFAQGQYLAVGEPGVILSSTNARQWTRQNSGVTTNSLKRAVRGNGLWVVVGTGGTILTSPDAINWTRAESPTYDDLNDVAYGHDQFVIVGDHFPRNATIVTSPDGIHWTSRIYSTGKNMRAVTFANGLFLALGNDGVIAVSTNGLAWSPRYCGTYYDGANLRAANFTEGLWTIVGNNGLIFTSTNTTNWTPRTARTIENLHGVEFFKGTYLTIGNRGNIWQSDRLYGPSLSTPSFQPQIGMAFDITNPWGNPDCLQVSTDLQTWTNLLILSETPGTTHFIDQDAVLSPQRFYRTLSP